MFEFSADFEDAIRENDLDLFNQIESQINSAEKECLLAVQNALRNSRDSFVYLEIGSHLGGSIQPYLFDPKCIKIFSIDKRSAVQADERSSQGARYPQNTTQRMMDNLRKISEKNINKIITFDSDASEVDKTKINPRPDLCFIDGEHTNRKVISDFFFCKSVIQNDGVIIFHDSDLIFQGIKTIIKKLKGTGQVFRAYFLADTLFVISFRLDSFNNETQIKLLRRKLLKSSIKRWILWSLFPSVQIRDSLFKRKR